MHIQELSQQKSLLQSKTDTVRCLPPQRNSLEIKQGASSGLISQNDFQSFYGWSETVPSRKWTSKSQSQSLGRPLVPFHGSRRVARFDAHPCRVGRLCLSRAPALERLPMRLSSKRDQERRRFGGTKQKQPIGIKLLKAKRATSRGHRTVFESTEHYCRPATAVPFIS